MTEPAAQGVDPWRAYAPALPDLEPWSPEAARWRLRNLAGALPFRVDDDSLFIGGNSNDVWLMGEAVLRVCWRADRDRFKREATVLQTLPIEIPHPELLDHGRTDDLSWILTRRGPGTPLHEATDLEQGDIRSIFRQLAQTLRRLHAWTPSHHVARLLRAVGEHPAGESPCPKELVPLSVADILLVADDVARLRFVDRGLIDTAKDTIESLGDVDASTCQHDSVVHGDPAWGNILVERGRLAAVIDFEWVRFGPIDLELVVPVFLGFRSVEARLLVDWLREDYPELFTTAGFARRMWLYQLSFAIRGILWWPPDAPEDLLTPNHHLHNLRRLSDQPPTNAW